MNVLDTQDNNVGCNQSMSEVETQVNSELKTWFDELKSAYQAEPQAEFEVRKQRLVALKKQLSRYQDVLAQAMSEDFGGALPH